MKRNSAKVGVGEEEQELGGLSNIAHACDTLRSGKNEGLVIIISIIGILLVGEANPLRTTSTNISITGIVTETRRARGIRGREQGMDALQPGLAGVVHDADVLPEALAIVTSDDGGRTSSRIGEG